MFLIKLVYSVDFQVIAHDLDASYPNNHIVYRIQSGASDKFVIGAETGTISVANGASLDPDLVHPKRTQYSLEVLALDSAPGEMQLFSTTVVNITIQDVNNKPPTFVEIGAIQIRENVPVSTLLPCMLIIIITIDLKDQYFYRFLALFHTIHCLIQILVSALSRLQTF